MVQEKNGKEIYCVGRKIETKIAFYGLNIKIIYQSYFLHLVSQMEKVVWALKPQSIIVTSSVLK